MFSLNHTERGRIGFAVETQSNAIRTTARQMAVAFARHWPMPLIVSEYGKRTAGEWVVIHDDLRRRAAAILGKGIERLADDVGMYERIEPEGMN